MTQSSVFDRTVPEGEIKAFEKTFSIDRFVTGDPRVLGDLYQNYAPKMYHMALGFKKLDTAEAEDAVQKSFIALWEKRRDFEHIAPIKAYLFTVTRNNCINDHRKANNKTRRRALLSNAIFQGSRIVTPLEKLENKDAVADVLQQIQSLPGKANQAMAFLAEGYKYQEVADMTGQPIGTVKAQIHLARKALAPSLSA